MRVGGTYFSSTVRIRACLATTPAPEWQLLTKIVLPVIHPAEEKGEHFTQMPEDVGTIHPDTVTTRARRIGNDLGVVTLDGHIDCRHI